MLGTKELTHVYMCVLVFNVFNNANTGNGKLSLRMWLYETLT